MMEASRLMSSDDSGMEPLRQMMCVYLERVAHVKKALDQSDSATDNMVDIRNKFMERMKVSYGRFHVMLSTGESLNAVCSQHPSVSVGHFVPRKRRKTDG